MPWLAGWAEGLGALARREKILRWRSYWTSTEYRDKVAAGLLRPIAPRRFHPEGRAWLPVLHTERGGRHYTALFSNTARAHELGKTGDWVVIYHDDGRAEREATVVTETRGPLARRRVVRGREGECLDHYGAGKPLE